MKAKDKYKQCKTWQCKVLTVGIYHAFTVALRRGASVRNTAAYFGVSIGTVSESLLLFKYVKHMKKIKTRKEALEIVRGN